MRKISKHVPKPTPAWKPSTKPAPAGTEAGPCWDRSRPLLGTRVSVDSYSESRMIVGGDLNLSIVDDDLDWWIMGEELARMWNFFWKPVRNKAAI